VLVLALFVVVSAAVSSFLSHSPHTLCGCELNISIVSVLADDHGTVAVDEVLGSGSEALSCAIEILHMAPGINEELLRMFFQNRKRSGGDDIEELIYQDKERRAVITFSHPEGCVKL